MPTYVSQAATSTTYVTAFGYDITLALLAGVVAVIGLGVILTGIGFAWRKFHSRAGAGKKF